MTSLTTKLRTLLNQICEERNHLTPASISLLKDNLNDNRDIFIKLLDNSPKNEAHRKTIQSGKTVIEGKEFRVNDDFTKQVLFLSDHLDIDEYEASKYLLAGISRGPVMNLPPLDASISLYHEERGHILSVLNVIVESAKDPSLDVAVRSLFTQFIVEIAQEKSTKSTLVAKILKYVVDIPKTINSISKSEAPKPLVNNQLQQQQQQQQLQKPTLNFSFQSQQQQPQQPQQQQLQQQQQQQQENNIKFIPSTISLRVEKLNEEQIYLVQLLYHITSLCWLAEDDIIALLNQIQSTKLSDATCPYLLIALLAAFASPSISPKSPSALDFTKNTTIIKKVHDHITTKPWKISALKDSTQIQWALFLSDIGKLDTLIEPNLPVNRAARIKCVETAIDSDAFGFINDFMLYFKQENSEDNKKKDIQSDMDDSAMAIDGLIVDPNDYKKFSVDISVDFQKYVVQELEQMTKSFIYNMSDVFSNLKKLNSEELAQESDEDENSGSLAQFLTLLATIYRGRLNAGVLFWDRKSGLSTFLAWLLDFKTARFLAPRLDLLGAIATGELCAPLAHSFLKMGNSTSDVSSSHLFSWGKLFSALQFYVNQYAEKINSEELVVLPANEEESLCKFIYLCQQVVQYSSEARMSIWSDQTLKAHETIVNMISCPTSTRLRASLYDLMAAFCSNWGGGIDRVGERIALEIWNTLEFSSMVIANKVMVPVAEKKSVTVPTQPESFQNSLFRLNNQLDIAEQWKVHNIINKPQTSAKEPKQSTFYQVPDQPGFLKQFEFEKSRKVYTQTNAFLRFFASLIHTRSKRNKLVSGFASGSTSIPFCLGSNNNRSPGVAPYMSLVIDHIFSNVKNLEFSNPESKWKLTDACLHVIENSVLSFDVQPISNYIKWSTRHTKNSIVSYSEALSGTSPAHTANVETNKELQQALLACITHPGFDVLVRILSGGSLILDLFKIVEESQKAFSSSKTENHTFFRKSIVRCLRVFQKVSQIQDVFVNVFVPQLQALCGKLPTGQFTLGQYTFPVLPPNFQSIGQMMLFDTEVIVQIALLLNCEDHNEVCCLSAALLEHLASDPKDTKVDIQFPGHIHIPMSGIGSKLASILSSSSSANNIILGASERLDIDSGVFITPDDYEYDINVIPFWLAEKTLGNIYRYEDGEIYSFSTSTRINILDILLKNLDKNVHSPTVAEFLLGYDVKDLQTSGAQIKSIATEKKPQTACLMSILALIDHGYEFSRAEGDGSELPLIMTHPVLAEKCYQLLYKLSVRESTSTATLFYLRNSSEFLLEQFKLITCRLERALQVTQPLFAGIVVCADHSQIETDYFTLVSVLNQRAWLMKLIALELHQNAYKSQKSSSSKLLHWLFGMDRSSEDLAEKLERFHLDNASYEQPLWNMLDIINSLDFVWIDQFDSDNRDAGLKVHWFKEFDVKRHMIQKDGYEVYDIRSIYQFLRQYQTSTPHFSQVNETERHAIEMEMGDILKYCMADNRHREISSSRLHCLRAWKQIVQVTLSDCFDLFSFEARERIIYDLLSLLLPKLEGDTGLHTQILKGLSDVVLSLLTRLREDKRRQSILRVTPVDHDNTGYSGLPNDKLSAVFNLIVKCILKEKSTIEMRSTMYSALVNLLQYITPNKKTLDDPLNKNIRAQVTYLILNESSNNILNIICRDANQDLSKHQTAAYAALEALYTLVDHKSASTMLRVLAKNNFIKTALDLIQRYDAELLKIIKVRDASTEPLNVHIAKLSFFMDIALKREGASLLLNNGILEKFADCQFINIRIDNTLLKDNPNAPERHRQLLAPFLELVNVMLKSLSEVQGDEMRRFENWVVKQDILSYILRDEEKETSLSSLYVLQLVTSVLYQLSRRNGYFVDLDKRELSVIDSTVMNLIPKYCLLRDWAAIVKPTNKEETKWSTEKAPETVHSQHPGTVLVYKADRTISKIRNHLLGYAQSSTFRGSQPFKPIFANTLESIKDITPGTLLRATGMTPSLTTIAACLGYTGKQLSSIVTEYHALLSQKENDGSLKYEEILEIAQTAIPKDLGIEYDSLNPSQQSQVLLSEINRRIQIKQAEIRELVFTIDNALFILWRHLGFYLDPSSIFTTTTLSPCERYVNDTVLRQQSLFQTSPVVISRLKQSCQTVLEPIVLKLESIPDINSTYGLPHIYKRIRKCYQ